MSKSKLPTITIRVYKYWASGFDDCPIKGLPLINKDYSEVPIVLVDSPKVPGVYVEWNEAAKRWEYIDGYLSIAN